MNIFKKLGFLSFSTIALLAACSEGDETLDTTPVETEETETTTDNEVEEGVTDDVGEEANQNTEISEQQEVDSGGQEDSPGIENLEFAFSVYDAIEIFNEEFGAPNIEEIQFEFDDGRYKYEIEGWDEAFDYEMDIDAETGEILSQESEADSDTDEDILDLDGIITPQEAMAIALEVSGGDYVEEWELELEDGYTVYDIDIEGGEDQDIDAHTGDVR